MTQLGDAMRRAARPRVMFCWLCGKRLRGHSREEREIDGHVRTLHKECSEAPDLMYYQKVTSQEEDEHEED